MSTTMQPGAGHPRSTVALVALALGSFVIGTAELVVVGILNLIADDLSVSVSTAGQLVTAYALGISIGGPIITALTIKLGRKFLLWLALAVYIVGNLVAVISVSFGALLIARVLTGSIHGLFIGVASTVAAVLVPAERRGQAMAMVFGGIAVSTVLGVPLGTLVGQALGWQAAFVGIVILGVIALAATLLLVPPVRSPGSAGIGAQARSAFAFPVIATLLVGFLLLGGQFTALTYLAPYLEEITGISGSLISVFLLAYGVASAVGTFFGGKFADKSATKTLVVANILLIIAFAGLYVFGGSPILATITLALWGLVGFGLVPSLQLRVITLAGAGGDLAATLGASAVNAGIAVGALVGGAVLAASGAHAVVLTALIVSAVALPATWAIGLLKVSDAASSPEAPVPTNSGAVTA
ncbi:DHA1 family inner membrane transport protein [Saccharothrix tamanrassetensis]|uniref:DHA1 family inner membrane transport protein n=1 Tax=Saccharothrix tamanrassetensis TaxID=1051531 RepID=A0A841CF67_9PSEU|nr:MFS transporter [Saccharothrix tamanrassetensis]MBB5954366.1 DHA1 family inner membrane transport protein [Saccharothrix tamanrassetensis]